MKELLTRKAEFQHELANWYKLAKRPLPWRTERSLYRTVVSEFMLQQTQIKTMLPYFERWIQRFPNFATLAAASTDTVLRHWEGLGYYSRARNLHKLAQTYELLDEKPTTATAWQTLPGIGPYTSAAISSISQGYPAAVVDGNVVRILARLTNNERIFRNGGESVKALTPIADDLLNKAEPGRHNEAMMELGATVCQKHNPTCTVCPVVTFCAGAASGVPELLPKIERKATVKEAITRLWIQENDNLLFHQIPDKAKQLAGQYELPSLTQINLSEKPITKILATKKRSITNRRITETIISTPPSDSINKAIKNDLSLKWISIKHLEKVTLSGPHRKWVNELVSLNT